MTIGCYLPAYKRASVAYEHAVDDFRDYANHDAYAGETLEDQMAGVDRDVERYTTADRLRVDRDDATDLRDEFIRIIHAIHGMGEQL